MALVVITVGIESTGVQIGGYGQAAGDFVRQEIQETLQFHIRVFYGLQLLHLLLALGQSLGHALTNEAFLSGLRLTGLRIGSKSTGWLSVAVISVCQAFEALGFSLFIVGGHGFIPTTITLIGGQAR